MNMNFYCSSATLRFWIRFFLFSKRKLCPNSYIRLVKRYPIVEFLWKEVLKECVIIFEWKLYGNEWISERLIKSHNFHNRVLSRIFYFNTGEQIDEPMQKKFLFLSKTFLFNTKRTGLKIGFQLLRSLPLFSFSYKKREKKRWKYIQFLFCALFLILNRQLPLSWKGNLYFIVIE